MNHRCVFIMPMDQRPARDLLEALGPVSAHWGEDHGHLLVYPEDGHQDHIARHLPDATRHRLRDVLTISGASAHARPTHHYVVWTDAAPGWEQELADWYAQEHLPGLASVPGAVRARRFEQMDEGPLNYACYDLTAPDILGSPAWLKVRATDWSSRVRPHFINTRRWMSATLRTPLEILI